MKAKTPPSRIESHRANIVELLRAKQFRPFALNMENGDRIVIEHPENIAFEPHPTNGSTACNDFSVISSRLRLLGTFDAITSVALADRGD